MKPMKLAVAGNVAKRATTLVWFAAGPFRLLGGMHKRPQISSRLCSNQGAEINVLHVVEPLKFIYDCGCGPVRREKPNRALMKNARTRLPPLARHHLRSRLKWDASVRSGLKRFVL